MVPLARLLAMPLSLPALTYWSAESMLPMCMAMKDEIADISLFLSGQEISSRRL